MVNFECRHKREHVALAFMPARFLLRHKPDSVILSASFARKISLLSCRMQQPSFSGVGSEEPTLRNRGGVPALHEERSFASLRMTGLVFDSVANFVGLIHPGAEGSQTFFAHHLDGGNLAFRVKLV